MTTDHRIIMSLLKIFPSWEQVLIYPLLQQRVLAPLGLKLNNHSMYFITV